MTDIPALVARLGRAVGLLQELALATTRDEAWIIIVDDNEDLIAAIKTQEEAATALTQLQQDNNDLQQKLTEAFDSEVEGVGRMHERNRELQAEVTRLRAALEQYGQHKRECEKNKADGYRQVFGGKEHVCGLMGYHPMKDPPCPGCETRHIKRPAQCDCGLTAALAAPEPRP